MQIKWKPIIITFLIVNVLITSFLLFIYFDNKKQEEERQAKLTAEQAKHVVEEIQLDYDMLTADNLKQMIEATDTIVLGKYGDFINTLSLTEDETASNPIKLETKLYEFKVDEVLKGNIDGSEIKVNHIATMLFPIEDYYEDENVYTNHTHTVKHHDPTFIKPETGESFILFLTEDKEEDFYTKAVEPGRIKINDDKTASLISNIVGPADQNVGTLYHVDEKTAFRVSIPSIPNFEDTITGKSVDDVKKMIKNK